nr:hypothetical protein [Longibacter salinarum]
MDSIIDRSINSRSKSIQATACKVRVRAADLPSIRVNEVHWIPPTYVYGVWNLSAGSISTHRARDAS